MTSTETRPAWSDRLSPRNWSLAWKLVAVGLVPALLAIVLGVLRVADQAQTASELGAANRLLEVRAQVADAATALRAERDRAVLFLAERRLGDRGPLGEAVTGTDAAIEQARTGAAAATDLDDATRSAIQQAEGGFAQLSVLRGEVTGSADLTPTQAVQRYSAVIDRTDVLDRALLRQVRTPDVAGLADALTAVTSASEALALQHTVLGAALRTGVVSPEDRAIVGVTDEAFISALTEYQVALPPSQTPVNFVTSSANAQRDAVKVAILTAPTPGPIPVTPDAWDDAVRQAADAVGQAGTDVRTALSAAGDAAEDRSSNLAGVNSVLLMLGLLLAATIVVLVARTLTRSLRVLRSSALDVAQRRLPQAVENMKAGGSPDVTVEPVPLHNRDEVGQVARAFDAVHGQALRLAADQAALQSNVSSMFVNLSRRSQGLVERQLHLIEQLESNEQDPDQLSNLFQLDHLATRMRRNSENLLVLAGTDFAKRNVAPVPLVDVLRAAVSEIEHYQRIVVQAPPQATIVGRATSDVVHLLAELLDNATNFSPPDAQVVMSSMRNADGSILVEIADSGVGMLEQELADANRRLGTPMAVDVSASRRMGLFVVGRLGARHGITVHLGGAPMGGPGGGLTASVTLPAHLVVSAGESGGRQPRGDVTLTPAAHPNGVPPQRAGQLGRPAPRPALAAPGNGQPVPQLAGLNGLPTRTPGSSLRREPTAPAAETGDPATTEQPVTAAGPTPAGATRGRPSPGRPSAPEADGPEGRRPGVERPGGERPGAGQDGPERRNGEPGDAHPAPEGAVAASASSASSASTLSSAAVASSAAPTGQATDDADTPPTGHPRDRQGPRLPDPADTLGAPTSEGAPDGAAATPPRAPSGSSTRAVRPAGRLGFGAPRPDGAETDRTESDRTESDRTEAGRTEAGRTEADRAEADRAEADRAGADRTESERTEADRVVADGSDRTDRPVADGGAAERDRSTDRAGADPDEAGATPAGSPGDTAADREPEAARQAGPATPDTAARGEVEQADGEESPGADGTDAGDRPAAPAARSASPRPRPFPGPGPNGTFHDLSVPAAPYAPHDEGVGQNGLAANGAGRNGTEHHGGVSPATTPLPVVPAADGPADPGLLEAPAASAADGDPADALFSASVPAIAEPDGLPRSRRPLSELRRGGPADITETTPIFEEIASAWFASQRPVPVDWELGRRPGAEQEAEPLPLAPGVLDRPGPVGGPERQAASAALPGSAQQTMEPSPAGAFATVADEGWRAASGAAAERPDELTAAGLPKRRPRARLVPGSAGSAVLAAPASPTRSAESIRGRLASYQQGVRQGRENRLRRDPQGAGIQPASNGENAAAPTGGEHDEDTR